MSLWPAGWNTSLFTFSMDRNYRREYMTDFVRIEWLQGEPSCQPGLTQDPAGSEEYLGFASSSIDTSDTALFACVLHLGLPACPGWVPHSLPHCLPACAQRLPKIQLTACQPVWPTTCLTGSISAHHSLLGCLCASWPACFTGGYMANQLSQEVFMDPDMMRRTGKSYEDFIQTKVLRSTC